MCTEHHNDHAHPGTAHGDGHSHGAGAEVPAEETAECPVMPGSFVNKADAEDEELVREHQGKKYYLCCDACAPMWDANPTRYAQSA